MASGLVVALAAGALTYAAVSSKGETVHHTDLDDGSVWVSSSKDGRFARVNKAVGQFDGGVASSSGAGDPVDILQDDNAVAGLVLGSGALTPIDARNNRLDESGGVNTPAPQAGTNQQVFVPRTVDLRAGTIAMVEPKTGKVWAQTYDPDAGLPTLDALTAGSKPLFTVGATAAVAVDVRGGVHAVSGATGKVVSMGRAGEGFAKPVTESVKLKDAKVVDITAVGPKWVVYSAGDDKLFVEGQPDAIDGGTTRTEGQPAYAALQQPGPANASVGLQDSTSLRLVSLGDGGGDGSGGVELKLGQNDTPPLVSRPLRTGQCIHAAWAATTVNYYGKDCGSQNPQPAVSIDRKTQEVAKFGVALRENHGLIVLNDLDGGEVWDLDNKPLKLDEWDSLIPPPQREDQTKKKDPNLLDESSVAQPPKAEPDFLKVRAGTTSKLHVLDNDTDAAGSVLAIDPGDVSTPDMPGTTASVAADGQTIDVTVPKDPAAQSFSFSYRVNNGKAPQKPQAKVTVTLVPDDVNSPPRLRPGTANLSRKTYPVLKGKLIPVQVIGDWRDPESDALTIQAKANGSSVDGLGRLNVVAGDEAGTTGVDYAVSDGRASTSSTVSLKVLAKDDPIQKPQTQPDVVRGVVGKPLQVEPLGNDIPGADPTEPDARMRLSRALQASNGLDVETNLDTGVVTITGSAAGTFDLSYGAQVGGGIAAGKVRVDLIADPDPDAPPVAVPDSATLRDQTPVLTDVLANDYSPRADVLVTRSVSVSSDDSWLRPSIYQGRWVRIESLDPASGGRPRLGKISYTISDGSKSTTGQISVTQYPADDKASPVVEDDEAVVRAQDSVTIPVMDNDSMADGIPLVLDPASVKVINGAGFAFASGNVVRFVPKDRNPVTPQVVTLDYAVYPLGNKGKNTSGRVTVTVMPLPTRTTPNQAPVARSFSTSVTAGDPLTITIPSSGVDPDGDSVTVVGLIGKDGGAVDLKYGRVTGFGPSTIKYEAYPTSAGSEVLNYQVRDRYGATGEGFVRIGVVQPGDPQPPVAVEDEVRAKPGRKVTVDATMNDLIARGDSIDLKYKEPTNSAAELKKWKVDEANTYFTTTVPTLKAGPQKLNYAISNGLFDPSGSTIAVIPDEDAKNPPIAVDDTAKPKPGDTSAVVDVLANDRDIDGPRESLTVSQVLDPDAKILPDGSVQVPIRPYPYTVPYVITDQDKLTGMALIYVPTGDAGLPYVVSGKPITMDQDSSKDIKLADYVKSPRARVVSITTADNVSASPADVLRAEADGRSGLTLTSSKGYIGPASVMLEVSDQETVQQKDFKTTYVSLPVQIGPVIPLLRCPNYTVRLNAGGLPRDVDIPTLCHAWVPIGLTLDDVTFESSWKTEPKGVELTKLGTRDRVARLKAKDDAPSSTDGRLSVRARGGPTSTISISVLGQDRGQDSGSTAVDANGKPLPTLRPPRLRPFTVQGLEAGSSRTVDLRGNLDSPLESPTCEIGAATPSSGSGLTTSFSGCQLTVKASSTARGTATVDVSVSDKPGRSALGRGTVTILGPPDKPTDVAAEADRVNGGFARVRWTAPAADGGSPITRYDVVTQGPGGTTVRCTASPCTIKNLKNGARYRFTVAAVNAIGSSDPAGPSNEVIPDTLPNPVNGVRMEGRGDRTLTIAWPPPTPKGSAVKQYQVRVTDTTDGTLKQPFTTGTRITVGGLTNDHEQSVQVRAKNDLGFGPFGQAVKMQSVGTPPAVGAPTVNNAGTGPAAGSSRLTITWNAVRPNGPPLTKYTVYESRSGGAWQAIGTTSPGQRSLGHTTVYDGATYRYVVTATNGGGKEGPQTNSTSFSSVGIPEVPGRPSVTTPRADHSADVRVSVGDSRSGSFTQLQWRNSPGRTGTVACGCPEGSTKQFTIASLGTGASQTLQVRAYNGTNWSDWSSASNSYRAYGPTPTPGGFRASRQGDNPVWTWNLRTDGRAIDKVQYDGSFNGTAGAIERLERNGAKGKTYRLRVRAHAPDGGWSGWTNFDSVSIPDPPPKITGISRGQSRPSICGNCREINWSAPDVKPGGYGFHCYYNGSGSAFYNGNVTVNGNGTHGGDWCAIDPKLANTVKITITGGPSGTVSSGFVNF